jgi:hypothetical protein
LLTLIPAAVRYDRAAQRHMPSGWPAVGARLQKLTGHDFPVLAQMRSGRARRSIASMIRENLDASTSVIGLGTKVLAGAVFAQLVHDERLREDIHAVAHHHGVDPRLLESVEAFALDDDARPPLDDPQAAALLTLARAAASSPAGIDEVTVAACQDAGLSAAAVVEVVTWLAVMQMLHRLTCYLTSTD